MNYREIFTMKRLWLIFGATLLFSFGLLLLVGARLYQVAPPIPEAVQVPGQAEPVFTRANIHEGQDVWRRLGGMQFGSVWGHGGYLAPDWTADVLHREALAMLDAKAGEGGYEALSASKQSQFRADLIEQIRPNTYDNASGVITVSPERASAIESVVRHYTGLFGGTGNNADYAAQREQIALPENPLGETPDLDIRSLTAYWWWTAWAATTERPGDDVTYTNNWPHEPLVGNQPSAFTFIWTFLSVVILILGIGVLTWFFNREREVWEVDLKPEDGFAGEDPLSNVEPTPSMRAVHKYIWIVALLFGVQILLGAVTAHYAVEGQDFYGIPLSDLFPYALTRTWHVQLSVLWIAVAWLGAGLYAAPMIAGFEPKGQKLCVNLLWGALVFATVGALAGQWAAIQGLIHDPGLLFWFGHQGYEFLDFGRFWQILLFIGLLAWGVVMARAIMPAIRRNGDDKHLLILLLISSAAIAFLFGAGLLYDRHTNLTIAEYWRWWVVHLWVEGVFEVFATAWIAWVFVRMRLLRASTAGIYVMFSAMIFLGGGVLGTFHHLYFSGTPEGVLALGAVFSALEVVPLALIAFEAHDHWRIERDAPWVKRYHLPLMFFMAVAFWNLVGAGVLGFLINPPLALYYMQGLMTTPAHGHAALFGVYGMLGIGLILFCRRGLAHVESLWSDKMLTWAFWLFNIGLALMVFGSILPQGIIQAVVSFGEGYWYARDAELMRSPLMETLVWMRVPGDIVFTAGAGVLLLFLFRLDWKGRKAKR